MPPIELSRTFNRFALSRKYVARPLRVGAPNRIVAFRATFNKDFVWHINSKFVGQREANDGFPRVAHFFVMCRRLLLLLVAAQHNAKRTAVRATNHATFDRDGHSINDLFSFVLRHRMLPETTPTSNLVVDSTRPAELSFLLSHSSNQDAKLMGSVEFCIFRKAQRANVGPFYCPSEKSSVN